MTPKIDTELQTRIMQLLMGACDNCSRRMECPEEACVIWNIEQLIWDGDVPESEPQTPKKGLQNKRGEL